MKTFTVGFISLYFFIYFFYFFIFFFLFLLLFENLSIYVFLKVNTFSGKAILLFAVLFPFSAMVNSL